MMLALVFSVGVSAQKTVIKGNISDRENLPVIGAKYLGKKGRQMELSVMWTVNFYKSPSAVPRLFYLLNISAIKMWKKVVSPMMKNLDGGR